MRLHIQQTDGDCAIACLATLLRLPYSTILKVASRYAPQPAENGMHMCHIRKTAKRFGVTLEPVHKDDIDFGTDCGILSVDCSGKRWKVKGKPCGHVVVLWKGVIFDPTDNSLWTIGRYLRSNKAKLDSLLRR